MSSAPAQLAVAPTASTVVTSTPQIQKDFLDETLGRQNSVGNRVRGNLKGKHLTRSHAMREATSPPRTPTPRSEILDSSPVSFSSTETINDSKLRVQSSPSSTSPSLDSQCVMSNNCNQHPQQNSSNAMYSSSDNTCGVVCNQSQLDVDFPKLTPPKSSKCSRNSIPGRDSGEKMSNIYDSNKIVNNSPPDLNSQPVNNFNGKKNCDLIKVNGQINNGTPQTGGMQMTSQPQGRMHHHPVPEEQNDDMENSATNSCGGQTVPCPQNLTFDKENRCLRNDAQNSINASGYSQDDCRSNMNESPQDNSLKGERLAKKHRSGATSKGSKPRLKNMGSSSSMDGGNSTSGFISRDSSTEQFTDQSGVDLLSFFKETLNKNLKDRTTLLNIEKELVDLANDKTQHEITFPSMSSYNRMLIHRVAAFFGMDHNVDNATQQCVIVAKTKSTRIPDIRFASLLRERMSDEPRKSILKRDSHSFEDPRQGFLMVDRGVLDRKAKSFEEREEEYEKVRRRIFKGRDGGEITGEEAYWHWSSTESSEQTNRMRQNSKLLKVQSMSTDSRSDGRPSVSKSHSFGGYGGPPPCGGPLTRGDSVNSTKSAGGRLFTKQDSIGSSNTPWRLSPSSSGSIYHFDPSNLPPSQAVAPGIYNNKSIGTTMIRNNRTEKRSKSEQICGEKCSGQNTSSSATDGSVETLSESSSQTVLNANQRESDDNQTKVTKENHINREMSDIQEEFINNALDDSKKELTNSEDSEDAAEQKPKLKNQATSPNIPSPVPSESPAEHNQTPANESNITDSCEIQANLNLLPNSESASPTNIQTETKKDDAKPTSSNIPLMNYAPNYTPTESNTVFPSPGNGPYPPTAYQQAPDGSVYAVPQQMVYAYPPPMDGEIQGYFMPIYEQTGQRDPNGLVPAATQAIYQPTGGTTAVVPVAYPTTPFGGAPLYQGQVVYSPEQFAPSASTTGQMQQYQMTYPVGYPYPYNGYWGQAMTYYVPPPALGNAVPSSILPPPLPGTQSNPGNNPGNNGKRNSPPQQNMSSNQNSQSTTPANTYQFAQSVPFTLTSDPSGPTMYAIPQATVFPNMLPYGPPTTPSASAGVITTIPPHQPNAVISPLISHPSGPTGPPLPIDPSVTGYAVANANGNHANNNGTPHSAPSTPLSNPLPLPHQHRNPPLFATPPIMPNGYNTPMHNQNFSDHSHMGNHAVSNYDKKNLNNGGGKKNNCGSYIPNGRQNSYNPQNQRKTNIGDLPPMSTNPNSTNRPMHMQHQQQQQQHQQHQKRMTNDKSQTGGALVGNTNINCNSVSQNSDKPRTGIRSKPGNLDLRRSASQRNSPSTNSIESNNNSPNSIVSNHLSGGYSAEHSQSMYMTRGTHIPPMHPPTAAAVVAAAAAAAVASDAAAACHQPLIGTYNHPAPAAGMYIKYGQAYFAHPTVALPNNRRSPPSEIRPSLTPLTGVYPTVNMMLPAPRQMQPRHPNPNYKGHKPSR